MNCDWGKGIPPLQRLLKRRTTRRRERTLHPPEHASEVFCLPAGHVKMVPRTKKATAGAAVEEAAQGGSGRPPKVDLLLGHANDCLSRYDIEAALKFYEKAVSILPEDTELLDTSGELCLECGRSEDALNLFRRSIELAPNSSASKYMNMAQLLESHDSLAHYNKGIELLMAELEVQKDSPEAVKLMRSQLATAYVSMTEIFMTDLCEEEGAEAKCEELLGLALQHGPDSPEVYGQLASFRLCQHKSEEAKKAAYKAVGISNRLEESDKPPLLVRVGFVKLLIELDQLDEAEEFGRELVAVDDQFLETWYLLALVNYHQKMWAAAKECIESAQKILETEGVEDEEQACKIEELSELIDKEAGEAGDEMEEDD